MAKKQHTSGSFATAVRGVVQHIPRGRVMSYAAVAAAAHFPGAARAVGTLMRQNFNPTVPCHRVIRADGRLGQYNRGTEQKRQRLEREGVQIKNGRVLGTV
ncbi:MAG: MGMT family protein [Candidatus Moranbacteria bacterium]|nr:MGMT family protein [Candidatus Moranbacteria bacterium]